MKRVKLVVAYDGTNYCGWQLQPNGVTIEEAVSYTHLDVYKRQGKTKGHGTALPTIRRKIKWQVIESLEELPAREKQ